ncbi:MAG: outer membrane beta-barrel protein [Bacteroidota bacterium]
MKRCALVISLYWISHVLFAQYSISGRIVDEHDTGAPFANVLLLNSSDSILVKGSITDADGNYLLANVNPGNFIIKTSAVGYEESFTKVSLTENSVKIKDLMLRESSTELEAVVVEAEKPLYEQKIDRMVVNVSSSPIMAGNSVLEILEKSPGVVVDRQNNDVRMNGKNGVSVMINGKMTRMDMSTLCSMLDGMPSSNIDNIELITTPPASFDAEGNAGFINLVLKRNDYEGVNGNFSGMIGKGRKMRYSAGGSLNYRRGKSNVYGSFNFLRRRLNGIIRNSSMIENETYNFSSNSISDRHEQRDSYSGRFGVDYYLNSNTVIGIIGNIQINTGGQRSTQNGLYEIQPGTDTLFSGVRNVSSQRNNYMFNFNVEHQISDNLLISMDFDYIDFLHEQPQTYANQFTAEDQQISYSEDLDISKVSPLQMFVGNIDFSKSFSDRYKIEFGSKATINNLENDIVTEISRYGDSEISPLFSNYTRMDEHIYATYVSAQGKWNDLTMQVGLRYEHTITDLEDEDEQQLVYRNYGNFFPTAYITRNLGANSKLNFSYSYRITRPTFRDLAPFVLFPDPKTNTTGNTNLLPALTHSLKAGYSRGGFNFSLDYSTISNSIAQNQGKGIPGSDITLYTTLNLDRSNLLNLALSIPIYVTDWWEMINTLGGFYSHVISDYFDDQIDISNQWYNINTTQSFKLPNKFSLQLNGIYFSKSLNGASLADPYGMLSLGVRKEFKNNGGTLNLSIADIFRTNIITGSINTPGLNSYWSFDPDLSVIQLTYTNTFGNNKLKSRSKRETGAAEDLKRL